MSARSWFSVKSAEPMTREPAPPPEVVAVPPEVVVAVVEWLLLEHEASPPTRTTGRAAAIRDLSLWR
jgi:hypothetical protein